MFESVEFWEYKMHFITGMNDENNPTVPAEEMLIIEKVNR